MIYHDIAASRARQHVAAICDRIRLLEKQDGTEYEVAMLRARKADLVRELIEYTYWCYFGSK